MARHKEELTGGLVTSKDPAFLEPGQLSDIRNAVYTPKNAGLNRAPGRASFGTVSATAVNVVGLRDCHFDNGDHYLIAHASSSYFRAPVGDTGSFTSIASGLGVGTQLERVHFRNRFFLFNGVTTQQTSAASNRALYISATAAGTAPTLRAHGMLPVSGPPITATAAGVFSQTVTGFYEYWTTEVAKFRQDDAEVTLEGTFVGAPATVSVPNTSTVPVISMPLLQNPIATHWRVYRSPKKDLATDKKFPSGFQMGSDISTATASVSDSGTSTTTSYFFPTTYNTGVLQFGADWTNPSNLGADDTSYATVAPGTTIAVKRQLMYGYAFTGITGQINGIEVVIEAFVSVGTPPAQISVVIGRRTDFQKLLSGQGGLWYDPTLGADQSYTPTIFAVKSTNITAAAAGTTLTFGGTTDRWFPSTIRGLSSTDFNSDFAVVLEVSTPNVTVSVDYAKVRVSYGATPAGDSQIQFPTVVYTFGDITAQVGKNGPPPSSSTGDIYEDSLVVNDVGNTALIRYSFPGDPESFPATYFIDFETEDNDAVQLIRVVNERLVVALNSSIWRVNYLPSERDASFDTAKSKQPISRAIGCVGPMLGAVYSPDGSNERLAFVSFKGVFETDGFNIRSLLDKLNWDTIRSTTSTYTPISLVDDPEESCLRFLFRNDDAASGNETYRELRIHYDGRISGPVFLRNFDSGSASYASVHSSWPVPRSTGDTSIYYGYGGAATAAGAGKVYIETGTTIPANDANMQYTTRGLYLNDLGGEWTLDTIHGYCGSYNGTPIISYAALISKTNDSGEVTGVTKSVTLGGQRLHRTPFGQMAERMRLQATVTASAFQQEMLVLDGRDFGIENSGR